MRNFIFLWLMIFFVKFSMGTDNVINPNITFDQYLIELIGFEGKIFRGTFGPSVNHIVITNSSITEIEDGAFCANSDLLQSIKILNNQDFPHIDAKTFENCSTVYEITLQNVTVKVENNSRILNDLRKLTFFNLFSVNLTGTEDEVILAELFSNSRASSVRLVDVYPRIISDEVFASSIYLRHVIIGSYNMKNAPELLENALRNINNGILRTLSLTTADFTNVKSYRMSNLTEIKLNGRIHKTHEGRKVFFKNLMDRFPKLAEMSLNPQYFTENEVKFVEKHLAKQNGHLVWSSIFLNYLK